MREVKIGRRAFDQNASDRGGPSRPQIGGEVHKGAEGPLVVESAQVARAGDVISSVPGPEEELASSGREGAHPEVVEILEEIDATIVLIQQKGQPPREARIKHRSLVGNPQRFAKNVDELVVIQPFRCSPIGFEGQGQHIAGSGADLDQRDLELVVLVRMMHAPGTGEAGDTVAGIGGW